MLTLEQIEAYHHQEDRRVVARALEACGHDVPRIQTWLGERAAQADRAVLMRDALDIAQRAARLSHTDDDPKLMVLAAELADDTCRKHFYNAGSFVEYDWIPWRDADSIWMTIPWGTAFRGIEMLDTLELAGNALSADQQTWWDEALLKVGEWVYGNPVVGSYVFNCALDLCRLLWRLGQRYCRQDWADWALWAAKERITRDMDDEGWIQGESGGASGVYQLVGTRFWAEFAWLTGDPELNASLNKVCNLLMSYATPQMDWAGNFGTRSSQLGKLPPIALLVCAARGNHAAAALVQAHGQPSWSRDLSLWQAALNTVAASPEQPQHRHFDGINADVVRVGPWHAYFNNYDRSIWARGFANLWHAEHGDWLFSTQHSLPSKIEKAKLRLGDTSDWAGFPHVRRDNANSKLGPQEYDSQQRIDELDVQSTDDGVEVTWHEPLLDRDGDEAGNMYSTYHFAGERLEMHIALENLAPYSLSWVLDWHLLKHNDGFMQCWDDAALSEMEAGRLPAHHLGECGTTLPLNTRRVGIQIDRSVFVFEFLDLNHAVGIEVIKPQPQGLHSSNYGGPRLRLTLKKHTQQADLRLAFYRLPNIAE